MEQWNAVVRVILYLTTARSQNAGLIFATDLVCFCKEACSSKKIIFSSKMGTACLFTTKVGVICLLYFSFNKTFCCLSYDTLPCRSSTSPFSTMPHFAFTFFFYQSLVLQPFLPVSLLQEWWHLFYANFSSLSFGEVPFFRLPFFF